jgi:hypothetical protein
MTTFKQWRKMTYPEMGTIISPLAGNIERYLESRKGLKQLRTALRFSTRANFPEPLGLEDEALAEWKAVCLRPWCPVDVSREADILSSLFPRSKEVVQLNDFVPRHGPGAVMELGTCSICDKYKLIGLDASLRYFISRTDFPVERLPRITDTQSRVGKLHFAPKQLDKLRTVSMEPAGLMFWQLGGFRFINDRISHTWLKRHICLEKAELNCDLAWLGSITGEYATIDLSHASDDVKYQLVRRLFDNTSLRELIVLTRSKACEYRGDVFEPTYYAPMGSGLCFPIECLVFGSIVKGVMDKHRSTLPWRVYGDDIIVPTQFASEVINRLEELGFTPNKSKSFYSDEPGFRESCGGDYMFGEDVRPVYISRFWTGLTHGRASSQTIESCISLANRLWEYKATRGFLIRDLLRLKNPPMFSYDGEYGIYSPAATNYHLDKRWDEDYQTEIYKSGRTHTHMRPTTDEDEDIRLFEWLRGQQPSSPLTEGELSIGRTAEPRWLPAWRSEISSASPERNWT